MIGEATFSDDRKYRYLLTRRWNARPPLVFIMLNPSIADAYRDDPTIKRCIGFGLNGGYGGIEVYNLFARISTNPITLRIERDPIGPDNDAMLASISADKVIIVAWGRIPKRLEKREEVVLDLLGRTVQCLGTTREGFPRHPLYVKHDVVPVDYTRRT